ncbi:MAG TPA: hypothetical protein VH414_11235 [Lichenihabitans sp.]|jgi:hypothetical protein|nr:hypothetical protein [Lichenihabitans sp.]
MMHRSRIVSSLQATVACLLLAAPAAVMAFVEPVAAESTGARADPAMRIQPPRWTMQTFDLGAVFADRSPEGTVSDDCFRSGSWALFDRGMLDLTLAIQGSQTGPPVTFTSRRSGDGATEHIVTRGRCRDILSMRTETRDGETWQEAGTEANFPQRGASARDAADVQDAAATNERNRKSLAAMKTAAFGAKADADVATMTFRLGRLADACPQASGMAVFAQRAIYLHLPWDRGAAMVPSLARDADGNTAHLMLQWLACRVDLRVSRDILVGTRWQPAPLVPAPP